jgi:Plasmid encoded RepA protein
MARARVDTQLEMTGLGEAVRQIEEFGGHEAVVSRRIRLVQSEQEIRSALPTPDDVMFNYSGLCQTFLPHSRPADNHTPWRRQNGNFILRVMPGAMTRDSVLRPGVEQNDYVGVPYGPKARLIMFHLQTEGRKSRHVSLGKNLSAFLQSLGLPRTGGPRGSIAQVREQCLRIARCHFTMEWLAKGENGKVSQQIITDIRIVDGLEVKFTTDDWSGEVVLNREFHNHLIEHAVPLDRRAISMLAGNSLGLDLYVYLTYRLPRIPRGEKPHLSWGDLRGQIGSSYSETKSLARKVREVMHDVQKAYPDANVAITQHGLLMQRSPPSVPKLEDDRKLVVIGG